MSFTNQEIVSVFTEDKLTQAEIEVESAKSQVTFDQKRYAESVLSEVKADSSEMISEFRASQAERWRTAIFMHKVGPQHLPSLGI